MNDRLMKEHCVTICIEGHQCVLDKQALLDLMILLSERHGRVCWKIGSCGDMEAATNAAAILEGLRDAHAVAVNELNLLEEDCQEGIHDE